MPLNSPRRSTRSTRVLLSSAIVLLFIFGFVQLFDLYRVQAVSTNIVVSEFRVRGPNGGNDEFVELYNLSGAPVAIGGWKIRGRPFHAALAEVGAFRRL